MHFRQLAILLVLFFVALPVMASAQSASAPVVVLGINSVDGDDEVSRSVTLVLRQALSLRGYSVSDRDISLSQAQQVTRCLDLDIVCLDLVAESLSTSALVFGTMHRVNTDVEQEIEVELHYFDLHAHRIVAHYTGRLAINPIDEMVTALAQVAASALTEHLRTSTDAPPVATVPHHATEPRTAPSAYNRAWIGWGLIGLGAALMVADVPVWVRLGDMNADPSLLDYRYRLGTGTSDVCIDASAGDRIRSLCSEGSTLEALQYVFLALGLVSAGTGATLLATGVLVSPSVSIDRATLTVSGAF